MPMKTVNFLEYLPKLQAYVDRRARAQRRAETPITSIEFGLRLCEAGLLVLNFDLRDRHERDGEWTYTLDGPPPGLGAYALNGPPLKVQPWSTAYMNAGDHGVEFVLLSGKTKRLKPGADDATVAGVFGEMLLSVLRDAKARGAFDALTLAPECQVEVLEFDGMWEWPASERDLGRTNLYRKLRAAPLTPPKA